MFVPRKPHPFGKIPHNWLWPFAYSFWAKLVEGKDSLIKVVCNLTKGTTGLLLCLTKTLFNSSKVVVLDSGFCVLQSLIELKKVGVYAAAVIKKRH